MTASETTPLRGRGPDRAWSPRARLVAAAFVLVCLAVCRLFAHPSSRVAGVLALGAVYDAVGVSGGEAPATKDATLSIQCALACAAEGDATTKTLVELSQDDGARAPTCEELKAARASPCVEKKCGCMEKAAFQTVVDTICAPGETTVDYVESGDFAKKTATAESAACPADFAKTTVRARAKTNTSVLGVPLSASGLGYKTKWRPRKNSLQARKPRSDERAGVKAPTTFKLYTQCKTAQVRALGGEFWFKALTGAYVVRHNYGTNSFFERKNRIRMQTTELEDGVYGYTLTTSDVDWEYGFELENEDNQTLREIGPTNKNKPTILQRESCARRFGKYFNRVITDEDDPTTVSYVFGDCNTACPSDYMDSAFCVRPYTAELPMTENGAVDLGETSDARLVNLASVLVFASSTSVLNLQGGRTYVTQYNDGSLDSKDWIVGIGDRERSVIKMAFVRVKRDAVTGHAKMWMTETRKYTLQTNDDYPYQEWNHPTPQGMGCKQMYCNVARYPLPTFWDQSSPNSGGAFTVSRVEYTKLELGDAPPKQFTKSFDSGLLSSTVATEILAAGQLGDELDVRRIIIRSGTICGSWINNENCMFANAVAVNEAHWNDYSGATKNSKQWLIVLMDGYFKAQRIEVTLGSDGGVYARAIGARYIVRSTDAGDPSTFDPLAYDLSEQLAETLDTAPTAEGPYSSSGYGVGALTFALAAGMSPSLRGVGC